MKKNMKGTFAGFVIGLLFMTVLAPPLLGQKDFNMEEKKMIECYKRANPLFLEGAKQFTKGNLDKAEKKLLAALSIMPEHADACYVMAQLHLKRKALPEALAAIIRAEKNYISITRLHTFTYQTYLDKLRQQRQDLGERLQKVKEALSRWPISSSNPDPLRDRLENEEQSLNQNILSVDARLNSPIPPTFEVPADYFYIHGNALYQLRRPVEAAAKYQEAIHLDPRHGKAYNNLALVTFSQGKFREALDCLVQAEASGAEVNADFKKAVESKVQSQAK
jgi:tetratricopeptide (TPR) repeat protein